jgi:hypothetical protein
LKIFELQREIRMKEQGKDIVKSVAKEKARIIGGDEEADKIEEDYDVK